MMKVYVQQVEGVGTWNFSSSLSRISQLELRKCDSPLDYMHCFQQVHPALTAYGRRVNE